MPEGTDHDPALNPSDSREGSIMTFHVGQKVVCVDASISRWGCDTGLVDGAVYTIAAIAEFWDGIGFDLAELPARKFDGHHQAYNSERFRPAVECKTDISIFTDMLTRTGVDA
jgi:hypothetical protein